MMRRRALLALLAVAASAPEAAVLTDADRALLARIEAYLNGLTSLKARFLQTAPDGKTATGTAWLERPGRMRFEYDKPSPLLLVAGSGSVIFRDNALDQTTSIPVGQTPLGLLLRDRIALSGDVTITAFSQLPDHVELTLVRTTSPGDGTLTLFLARDPLALIGWSVVDAQGQQTMIRLTDIRVGGHFDPALFTYTGPQ